MGFMGDRSTLLETGRFVRAEAEPGTGAGESAPVVNAQTALTDADFEQTITIRSQPMSIGDALLRALAHISYHVGQIVYVAKSIRGAEWQTLSIPKGASKAYNQNPGRETAEQHAAMLDRRKAQ